jgi:hypothetical protein
VDVNSSSDKKKEEGKYPAVDGKECHLYYEFDKWFMERKSA